MSREAAPFSAASPQNSQAASASASSPDNPYPTPASEAAPDAEKPLRATCECCPHRCAIAPGATGVCRARANGDGRVVDENYGRVTSVAVDPIEKKPLARFRPGTQVLSVGSYGCNLRCPWCQNYCIAQAGAAQVPWRSLSPQELAATAADMAASDPEVTGVAYTYNEPLCGWEYVRDCARLVHGAGLCNVLVSNGCFEAPVIEAVAPLMDAVNIDLKCFNEPGYRQIGGDLECVKAAIATFAATPTCHVEVTSLIVPGFNDSPEEMDAQCRWLAQLDPSIVLHITRFFPAYRCTQVGPTPLEDIYRLTHIARTHLQWVYTGNC